MDFIITNRVNEYAHLSDGNRLIPVAINPAHIICAEACRDGENTFVMLTGHDEAIVVTMGFEQLCTALDLARYPFRQE